MNIQVFTHYFPPEGNAPATRHGGLTKRWAAKGEQVYVITCVPNVPDGKPYEGFRNRIWPRAFEWNGVRGCRVWTYLAPNTGTIKRILNYLSYWMSANLCGPVVQETQRHRSYQSSVLLWMGGVFCQMDLPHSRSLEQTSGSIRA